MAATLLAVTPVTASILRLSVYPESAPGPPAERFDTPELHPREWRRPTVLLTLDAADAVEAEGFRVAVGGTPPEVVVSRDGREVQHLQFSGERVLFDLGASRVYGLGHGLPSAMNRRSGIYDTRPTPPRMGALDHHGSTVAVPFIVSTGGWGLFVHAPRECLFNLGGPGSDDTLQGMCQRPGGDAGSWDLFLVDGGGAGDGGLAGVVAAYYELTGRPPLPPKYAFGYLQSHRELQHGGVDFKRETASFFRDSKFPCDLLIYLSSGLAGNTGWNTGMGSFDYNPATFPEPVADLSELREAHFRVALHAHHCPPDLHGTVDENDVLADDSSHAKNYWARHAAVLEEGAIAAWWPDGGDELPIEGRLLRHRMYWQGALQSEPDTRPLALHRTGYAGMTRWGGVVWSGDVLSEWRTLATQIHVGLNAAVSYSPFWGCDVGGFMSTREYDGELFVRWLQYAAFTPFLRSHGRPSWLHAPHGWSRYKPSEIPTERAGVPYFATHLDPDEGVSPDPRVEPISRRFVEWRYRLLPYIYNAARQAHTAGLPMMRPMWLLPEADPWYAATEDQYFFGDSLLVAPVYQRGATSRSVALPDGIWYGLLDGKVYEGGRHVLVDTPLDSMPVLVPAGTILPLGDALQWVGEPGHTDANGYDNLELLVYPGADTSLTLYEDDGISLGYQRGEYTTSIIRWDDATRSISATGETTMLPANDRRIRVTLRPGGERWQIACRYSRR